MLEVKTGEVEVGCCQVEMVDVRAAVANTGEGPVACEGVRVEEADVVEQEVAQGHFHRGARCRIGFWGRLAGKGIDDELVVKDRISPLPKHLGRQITKMYFFDIQIIMKQSQHSQPDV